MNTLNTSGASKTGRHFLLKSIVISLAAGILAGWLLHHEALKQSIGWTQGLPESVAENFRSKVVWPVISRSWTEPFQWMSDIFLRMIKMIIAPLILSILISGISRMGDMRTVGRLGLKTMIYFTLATLIALILGLLIVNVFEPGKRMNLPFPENNLASMQKQTASNLIAHIIPSSVIKSMAENDILPIVVFSVFFGMACTRLGKTGEWVSEFFERIAQVMFKVTEMVMFFAPLGIFGAMTSTLIQQGPEVMKGYLYLIACFFGGLLFFVFVVLGLVCRILKVPFFKLLRFLREPLMLAFSTASSESAMPKTILALEQFGISNRVVSFVLPLGYSFNLDGSIMYMTFATLFIAQSYGMELSAADQIRMMLILLITSKGMAGVPRASLVVIAGMLDTFHIPQAGLLLLLGIDQLLDMGRSAVNVVGNAVASAAVGRWEGERYNAHNGNHTLT